MGKEKMGGGWGGSHRMVGSGRQVERQTGGSNRQVQRWVDGVRHTGREMGEWGQTDR